MSSRNFLGPSEIISLGVCAAANRFGVTLFTRSSVHCADRITATSASNGLAKFSGGWGSGNSLFRIRITLAAFPFSLICGIIILIILLILPYV